LSIIEERVIFLYFTKPKVALLEKWKQTSSLLVVLVNLHIPTNLRRKIGEWTY